jgi:ferredoxin-fold anticodon binding domain-containing protein
MDIGLKEGDMILVTYKTSGNQEVGIVKRIAVSYEILARTTGKEFPNKNTAKFSQLEKMSEEEYLQWQMEK